MTALAHLVTGFFRQHLAVQKGVSKNTIASYSYAFKFLCRYVSGRLGKPPAALFLEDLDAPMVRDFLEHLEQDGARAGPPNPRDLEQANRAAPRQPFDQGGDEGAPGCTGPTHARRHPRPGDALSRFCGGPPGLGAGWPPARRHRTRWAVSEHPRPGQSSAATSSPALERGDSGTSRLAGRSR
jgi:hypothetical protein